MTKGFRTSLLRLDSTALVSVEGEVDLLTGEQFRAALLEATASGAAKVAVDLSRVEFFGSDGIRHLLEVRKQAEDRGVTLRVAACTRSIQKVLAITGVAEFFGVGPGEAAPG